MANLIEMTDAGLVYMTESEIYQAVIDKYQEVDPNINLDASTFDGYMAAWHAENYRILVEALVEAWNSKDPAKARDTQLNIIGSITGSSREDGTPTIIDGTVTGTNGTVIPAGSVVSGEYSWAIDEDVTIGASGVADVTATCSTSGIIEPETGSITNIKSTIGGWASFTNTGINTLGTDQQSNALFRVERTKAVSRPSSNQIDSTIGEIFAIDDVLRVAAYENSTDSADYDEDLNPYSLPAHSVSYVVQGGDIDSIASAIYIKKNPGVTLNQVGTGVSATVTSNVHSSNSKLIKFGRPTNVNMVMNIELVDPNGNLPSNVEDSIRESVISYVNGELIDADDGFDSTGFDIGEDVPVRRMDTPVNQVVGQYKNAYISTLSINGVESGAVSIAFDEISNWTSENITVTVV